MHRRGRSYACAPRLSKAGYARADAKRIPFSTDFPASMHLRSNNANYLSRPQDTCRTVSVWRSAGLFALRLHCVHGTRCDRPPETYRSPHGWSSILGISFHRALCEVSGNESAPILPPIAGSPDGKLREVIALVPPQVLPNGTFPSNLLPRAFPRQSLFHSAPFTGL